MNINTSNTIDKNLIIDLLSDLVRIESPFFQEEEIMNYVFNILNTKNLGPRLHEYHETKVTNFKGLNVIGELDGGNNGPTILLNGHLDTVKVCDGWETDPFEPVIKDGRLYGLGSVDMKSGCTAIIIALEAFKNKHPKFNGKIIYNFVSDEEGPFGLGTSKLIDDGICDGVDLALVLEPSSTFSKTDFPTLCLGARGGYSYDVELTGKTAHAANPEDGINAIVDASKLMLELQNIELIEHELLGKGSICITDISGCSPGCSVADKASFSVFRHIVIGEDKDTIINEVRDAIERSQIESKVDIKIRTAPCENTDGFMPYVVDRNHQYSKQLLNTIKKVCEKDADISYFSSIGDFNYLGTRVDVPTFVFGPHGANFHTANEYVVLDSVIQTAEIIYEFLIDLLL